MIPPPMTNKRLQSGGNSSAPLESMTRGSSGNPGSRADSDPAAMMHCLNSTRRTPSAPFTSKEWGPTNLASPRITVTLRCFASSISPLVNRVTTLFFHARSKSRSIFGGAKTIPFAAMSAASSMTFAACNKALEGMHPTFKHTPPSTGQRSIKVTCMPKSPARNAAVYPPTPAPSTTKSTAPAGAALTGLGSALGEAASGGAALAGDAVFAGTGAADDGAAALAGAGLTPIAGAAASGFTFSNNGPDETG